MYSLQLGTWERRRNRKSFGGQVESELFYRASIRSIRSIWEREAVAREEKEEIDEHFTTGFSRGGGKGNSVHEPTGTPIHSGFDRTKLEWLSPVNNHLWIKSENNNRINSHRIITQKGNVT